MMYDDIIHNVIIIINACEFPYQKPERVASCYFNRFVIDADANFEILGFYFVKQYPQA